MTANKLFETTNIPGHLAPTVERLERLISKQSLEELYEVEEEAFARGKYAMVKRCRERSSGKQWAAKFLKKRRRAEEFKAEVLHEMAVLDAAAPCPHLVSLHQVFETNTDMILVLELATGGELQLILDRDEVPEERQVARLLKQIMEGIIFLHSLNIAHLDLKPQNLVLTGEYPNCDVKLCDFGISRHVGQGVDIREILGTPDYVAPEVLNYEPISLATDMWSVGVLFYVLLTGCSPFGGDTNQETFCNISRCQLDFPDDLFEDISEEACDLICKLIVKDPKRRLTATECLEHPWFSLFEQPSKSLTSVTCSTDDDNCVAADSSTTPSQKEDTLSQLPIIDGTIESTMMSSSTPLKSDNEKPLSTIEPGHGSDSARKSMSSLSAVSSHTENVSVIKIPPKQLRVGLNPDRMDTFKKNMDSLVRKFTPQVVLVDSSLTTTPTTTITTTTATNFQQRRATAVHTMPAAGEVFKCTPVFILGETQRHQCNDNSSDTISEISMDSASDRSSIYSDSDSLDFILCNKSQTRMNFPFSTANTTVDGWHHRRRMWPRECSDVVSKTLSRLTSEGSPMTTNIPTSSTTLCTYRSELKISFGEHGNLVVIREPVRTGKYTMYSEVQCESLKARMQRLQVSKSSS